MNTPRPGRYPARRIRFCRPNCFILMSSYKSAYKLSCLELSYNYVQEKGEITVLTKRQEGRRGTRHAWEDNKVRELDTVKMLHTSLQKTTVVALKVLPLGSYAPMPAPSPTFKTILEMVLWNGLQSCRCIKSDVISIIKIPSLQYFLYLQEQRKVTGG